MTVLRPLLSLSRVTLEQCAQARALRWIQDPSNADERWLRNAIRHRVLPAFEAVAPALRASLPRAAQHWREAQAVLAEVASDDLATVVLPDGGLDCRALCTLAPARRLWVLRAWWTSGAGGESRALRPLASAQLDELQRALVERSGSGGAVWLGGQVLWRSGDQLHRLAGGQPLRQLVSCARHRDDRPVAWRGEDAVVLAPGGGRLRIRVWRDGDPWCERVPADALANGLGLRAAPGHRTGLRTAVRPGAPSRTLKNLYQEHGVPSWARPVLPVLALGERAVWTATFGADQALAAVDQGGPAGAGDAVRIEWDPPDALRGVRDRFCTR